MDKPDELLLRLSLPAALASCESGTFVLSSENRRTGGDDLISVGTEGPSPADPADTGAEQRERGGEVSQSGLSECRCIMDNSETVRLLFDSPLDRKSTSELQSRGHLVCRLLLENKKN